MKGAYCSELYSGQCLLNNAFYDICRFGDIDKLRNIVQIVWTLLGTLPNGPPLRLLSEKWSCDDVHAQLLFNNCSETPNCSRVICTDKFQGPNL